MIKYPVFLGACAKYDAKEIATIISTALQIIPISKPISGKIVIKPNLVMAHPKVATECFTRKEVIEGILRVVQTKGEDVTKIDIVGKIRSGRDHG